jgi:hypothetical protein
MEHTLEIVVLAYWPANVVVTPNSEDELAVNPPELKEVEHLHIR